MVIATMTYYYSEINFTAVQLLNAVRDLANFNRPPDRDYQSVKSYFDEEDPLCNVESYILHKEDIVSLKPGRENAWLDAFVEKILQKLYCKPIRVGSNVFFMNQL
jgi:hypothetical protein